METTMSPSNSSIIRSSYSVVVRIFSTVVLDSVCEESVWVLPISKTAVLSSVFPLAELVVSCWMKSTKLLTLEEVMDLSMAMLYGGSISTSVESDSLASSKILFRLFLPIGEVDVDVMVTVVVLDDP
jgi:hypothetical protein